MQQPINIVGGMPHAMDLDVRRTQYVLQAFQKFDDSIQAGPVITIYS